MRPIAFKRSLNFKLVQVSFYYLQRAVTPPIARALVISLLRCMVNIRTHRFRSKPIAAQDIILTLRKDGLTLLGTLLTEQQCDDILRHLQDKKLSHRSAGEDFTISARPANVALGNYSLNDLVHCPHILALANHPEIIALARSYLGCMPTLSGLSARWSFVNETCNEVVQQFHRDSEDWKAFRIMIYLTDVDDKSGPHVYVTRTHLDRRTVRLKVWADSEIEKSYCADRITRQAGKRGFGFAVDTAGLHKGEAPQVKPRLLLSFQYSIFPCFLYEYEPVAVNEFIHDAYINRLIIRKGQEVEPQPALDYSV